MFKVDAKKRVRFISLILATIVVLSGLAIALIPVEAAEAAESVVLSGGDIVRVSAKVNNKQLKCSCYQLNVKFESEYLSITENDIVNKIVDGKTSVNVARNIDNNTAICNMFTVTELPCPSNGVFCTFDFKVKDGKKIDYSDVAKLLNVYRIDFFEDSFASNLGKNCVTIEYSYKKNSAGEGTITSVMIGDIDGNKKITNNDLTILKGYVFALKNQLDLSNFEGFKFGTKTSCYYNNKEIIFGDIDGNGRINNIDVAILKAYKYYIASGITIPSEMESFNLGEIAYSL